MSDSSLRQDVEKVNKETDNRAGKPMPSPVSDAEVIIAIRAVIWDAMRGREMGGDRTLVGMVRELVRQRDEARDNRRGEFEKWERQEAELSSLRDRVVQLEQVALFSNCSEGKGAE